MCATGPSFFHTHPQGLLLSNHAPTNSVLGRRSASDHRYGRTLHQAFSPDLNVAFDSLMTWWTSFEARSGSTRPHCLKPWELSVSRKKLRRGPRIQSTIGELKPILVRRYAMSCGM